MNLNNLIKLICAGAIVGACLLVTGCGDFTVNYNSNNKGGADTEDNTPVPQQTQPNGDAANTGLTIDQNTGKIVSDKSSVDFSNYANGTFSIKVRNNTHERLVAFKNVPSSNNLLSGIPAYESNWGLKFKSNLFTDNNDFILFVVKEDDYIEHMNRLEELEYYPFAKIYAFYNNNTDGNNNVYDISSHMGGNCTITFDNRLGNNNVELRNGSINGETIGYAAALTAKTTFKVDEGQYYIYPVFRSYSKKLNEIVTRYPKTTDGYPVVYSFELRSPTDTDVEIDPSLWEDSTPTPNAAYIMINNNLKNGSISFYDSGTGTALTATDGSTMINSGRTKVFCVLMNLIGGEENLNPEYATYRRNANYYVKTATTQKYITTGTAANESFDFYAGKMYEIDVDSDGSSYGFKINLNWKEKSTDVNYK